MNDDMEKMCMEADVIYLEVLPKHSPQSTERNENNLQNTKQKY